jgi:hypothetical protein
MGRLASNCPESRRKRAPGAPLELSPRIRCMHRKMPPPDARGTQHQRVPSTGEITQEQTSPMAICAQWERWNSHLSVTHKERLNVLMLSVVTAGHKHMTVKSLSCLARERLQERTTQRVGRGGKSRIKGPQNEVIRHAFFEEHGIIENFCRAGKIPMTASHLRSN